MNLLSNVSHMTLIVSFLCVDLLVCLLAKLYVAMRMRGELYKYYASWSYKALVLVGVFLLQVYSVYLHDSFPIPVEEAFFVSFLYLFVSLVDISIRIIGNGVVLAACIITFACRFYEQGLRPQIPFIAFALLVFCLLIIAMNLTAMLSRSRDSFGMGDTKLLTYTAFVYGFETFIEIMLIVVILLSALMFLKLICNSFTRDQMIAFAPIISLSSLIVTFVL